MALNSLFCADVQLRIYSLTHYVVKSLKVWIFSSIVTSD